jgi:voltage-gated potassium channel Kch
MMSALIVILSLALVVIVLWDAFETIVLPRRVTRRVRLTSVYYRASWRPWRALCLSIKTRKRREALLSIYGPLSLIALLSLWAITLIFSFALLHWALGTQLQTPDTQRGFGTYLYMSGVTFFTLGFGDVIPLMRLGRTLAVVEAGVGFGFLALIIGYLPVIYQGFSAREVNISLLDARAGTPPTAAELLRRHGRNGNMEALNELLKDWERWGAELMESHLSYPVLCYFRSQHDNQSWLSALATILDTCALVMVGVDGAPNWQAQLTFAMARHAVVDISQIFDADPRSRTDFDDRLWADELARLRASLAADRVPLRDGADADERLAQLRRMYESYMNVLADYLAMPLPPWIHAKDVVDNWQTSAWERNPQKLATTFKGVCDRDRSKTKMMNAE